MKFDAEFGCKVHFSSAKGKGSDSSESNSLKTITNMLKVLVDVVKLVSLIIPI